MTGLGLTILAALLLSAWGASAIDLPACLTKTDDGGLSHGVGSVVVDKKEFYSGSTVYPVHTFSDQAATGNTGEFCLRYEIENPGPQLINNLYWKLAGIRIKEFRPGLHDRQSRSKQMRSISDPKVTETTINAFANETATPKVWAIEQQQAFSEGEASNFAEIVAVGREAIIPQDLSAFLEANAHSRLDPVLAVNLGEEKVVYPVREKVSGHGFTIEVTSRVVRDGSLAIFETSVTLDGENSGDALISMPTLRALEGAKVAQGIEYYAAYLDAVSAGRDDYIGDFSQDTFSTTVEQAGLYGNNLYLSEHLIMLQANDNQYCYRFESYTPFAIDFDLDRCQQ